MSKWNHLMCFNCYAKYEPARDPVRVKDAEVGMCCACHSATSSGIWYRKNPEAVECNGSGGVHSEQD